MGHIHTIVQFVTLFIQYVSEGANVFHHPGGKYISVNVHADVRQYLDSYQVKKLTTQAPLC